jgi:hypothetical protein
MHLAGNGVRMSVVESRRGQRRRRNQDWSGRGGSLRSVNVNGGGSIATRKRRSVHLTTTTSIEFQGNRISFRGIRKP